MAKRVVLIPDGMADEPLTALGGRTPLQAAETPAMDELATTGTMGTVRTVPAGMPAGSDVANLAALGYDPAAVYTGRAPLEAANIGVELGPGDVAYRCNLVTIAAGVMKDNTAGHIASEQAAALMRRLDERLGGGPFEFHAGVSYRNLLVWRGGSADAVCTPPHDKLDCAVDDWLPRDGAAATALRDLMARAHAVVTGAGTAATDIWLWGQGTAPRLPALRELRGLDGAVVAAVDLVKGIGHYAGMEVLDVRGATGDLDTDYSAKACAALDALERHDFVYVHVEAPDEAGHMGDASEKVRAIERVDAEVLRPLLESLLRPCVLVLPDHYTPLRLRTHVDWPVPFAFSGGAGRGSESRPAAYSEAEAAGTGLRLASGAAHMDLFLTATADR
jgi:2,3-bisphosphoglycerate-independent phosphoglycerate mutase